MSKFSFRLEGRSHAGRKVAIACATLAVALRDPRLARADEPPSPASTEPPVTEVFVQGASPASAGSKSGEPLRDVPATVNTVTAKTLRERATTDLVGALENVAGVNAVLQYGGFSYLTIRGFKDFVVVVDGVRDDRYYFVESAPTSNLSNVSQIEVVKGPASALYGYGGIGGVVSITTKAPTPYLTYDGGLTIGGPDIMRRASAGVGGPVADTHLAYRLDAQVVDDLNFRGAQWESANVAGVLEWRPDERQTITIRGGFSRDRFNTDTGIPTGASGRVPAAIPLNRRFNTAEDYLVSRAFDMGGTYSLRPNEWLSLIYRIKYSYNPYSYASAETLGLGPNDTVTRGWFFLERNWKPFYNAVEVAATGKAIVEHRALLGYELGVVSADNPQADLSNTSLLPLPFAAGVDPQGGYAVTRTRRIDWRQVTHAFYAQDTVSLTSQLKLALGGRLDAWSLNETTRRIDPGSLAVLSTTRVTTRQTTAATWRAGLVYQPIGWGTLYGSVATAFRPAREIPGDGRELSPERGRQVEMGARGEFFRGRAHVNVAIYDLEKTNVVVSRGAGIFDQAGRQSSRGVELDGTLKPLEGLAATLGYATSRARYDSYSSPDGTDYSGKIPTNVSDHTFTLWSTFRMPNGFGFGLGGRVVGTSFADPANRVPLPAYALVDGALFYRFGAIELALNVKNVLGAERYFVSSINGTQLTPGNPRVAFASLRFASAP